MAQHKILVSPGFGAGWSTWSSGPMARFMLTYKPFIDYLSAPGMSPLPEDHPLVKDFVRICEEKFDDTPYLGGLYQLKVKTVNGPFKISEYDGHETLIAVDSLHIDLDKE